MNRKRNLINIGVTCLVIILALALTACNAPSQAAPEPDKVSVQLNWVFQTQYAGFFVAEQQGFYATENLKVNIVPGGPAVITLDKLVSKEVDFALVADAIEVLQAVEAGKPVVAVAALFQKNANVWISLDEKNITRAKDMIGKRIGVRPLAEVAYRILLAAAGIDREQVKDNEVVIEDFTIRPVIEGEVDVLHDFALDGPVFAKRQGHNINVLTLADEGILLPNQILLVRKDLLEANPDLVERFVRATLKGWNIAVNNPEEGVKATLKFDETLDISQQTDMMEATIALISPETASIGHMDDKMWQQVRQVALDLDLISTPLELDKIYTTQFLEK